MSRKQSAKERVRSAKLGVRVWCLRNWFGLALFFVAVLGLAIALALFIRPFKSTRIVNTTTVVNTTRSVQAAADVIFLIDGSGRWVGACGGVWGDLERCARSKERRLRCVCVCVCVCV